MKKVSDSRHKVLAENTDAPTLSSLLPWNRVPKAIFSLWDMKDFYAQYFFVIARELNAILFLEGMVKLMPAPWVIPQEKSLEIKQKIEVLCHNLGNNDEGGHEFGVVWTLANSLNMKLRTNDKLTYKELLES